MSTLKVNAITNVAGNADISGVGIIKSYAIIADQKSTDSNGGTFTHGAWRTRDLNTEISDVDGIVSISSNQFTLQTGTYLINTFAPAYKIDRHQLRLYNITDSSVALTGGSNFASSANSGSQNALMFGRITITSAKVFEIQHQSQTTEGTFGFGVAAMVGTTETFTVVKIYKET